MENINIPIQYLVLDSGTSDGTQDKYFFQNKWYKVDKHLGEGYNEWLASKILECTNIKDYVQYQQIRINNEFGCVSENFLKNNEDYISIYRLHQNVKGTDIQKVLQQMDFDDQKEYVVDFVAKETGINISEMLGKIFFIDGIILNEDRHFNNIGLIFDGKKYRESPIFDNGKSFFCGNKRINESMSLDEKIKQTTVRPFTATRNTMIKHFPYKVNVNLNKFFSLVNSIEEQYKNVIILNFDKLYPEMEIGKKINVIEAAISEMSETLQTKEPIKCLETYEIRLTGNNEDTSLVKVALEELYETKAIQ